MLFGALGRLSSSSVEAALWLRRTIAQRLHAAASVRKGLRRARQALRRSAIHVPAESCSRIAIPRFERLHCEPSD